MALPDKAIGAVLAGFILSQIDGPTAKKGLDFVTHGLSSAWDFTANLAAFSVQNPAFACLAGLGVAGFIYATRSSGSNNG